MGGVQAPPLHFLGYNMNKVTKKKLQSLKNDISKYKLIIRLITSSREPEHKMMMKGAERKLIHGEARLKAFKVKHRPQSLIRLVRGLKHGS